MSDPNSIGLFGIGTGAIGTAPFDWRTTVLSQYANSPILLTIIDDFAQNVDATVDIDAFYDEVWNIATAQGWGLDVWGRIVGVQRTLNVSNRYFGFEEMGEADADPFNQSPFYAGEPTTTNYALVDDAFRTLILAKALANISGGSIPEINRILQLLFPGRGNCFITDPADMTAVYTFEFQLSQVEFAIINQSGVLPKPTGVAVTVSVV